MEGSHGDRLARNYARRRRRYYSARASDYRVFESRMETDARARDLSGEIGMSF